MASQFQNRLVGTIILVALGIIFIPHVLDGKKTRVKEEFNSIPFAPVLEEQPLLIDLSGAKVNEPLVVDVTDEPQASSGDDTVALALEPVSLVEPAFVLQLGTFKNAQNVDRLVAKLRSEGYQAHSSPEPAVEGELNRVFVGPDVSQQSLEAQQAPLQKLTGLAGKIREFDPLLK